MIDSKNYLTPAVGEDQNFQLPFDWWLEKNVTKTADTKPIDIPLETEKSTMIEHMKIEASVASRATATSKRKSTEFIRFKIKSISTNLLFIQIFAACLAMFFMFLQNNFGSSCVFEDINNSNLLLKILETLRYAFIFKASGISMLYCSLFHSPIFCNSRPYKCFFLAFCLTFVLVVSGISIFTNRFTIDVGQIIINLAAYIVIAIFYFIYLLFLKNLKAWLIIFFKGGGFLAILITFNIIILRTIGIIIFEDVNRNFEASNARNLKQIIFLLYSILFKFVIKRFLFLYYNTLVSEKLPKDDIDTRMIIMSRIAYLHYATMNVVSIIQAKINDYGGWLLIVNYFMFLTDIYTRINVPRILYTKILRFFGCKIKPKEENFKKFEHIFSGCSIDIQFIVCIRLLLIFYWNKWICIETTAEIFFKDCEYGVSSKFIIYFTPLIIIVSENAFILVLIALFVLCTHKKLFVYKIFPNPYLNLYLSFCLHHSVDGLLQLYSLIFIGKTHSIMG